MSLLSCMSRRRRTYGSPTWYENTSSYKYVQKNSEYGVFRSSEYASFFFKSTSTTNMLRQKENVLFLVHTASVYRGTMDITYNFFYMRIY